MESEAKLEQQVDIDQLSFAVEAQSYRIKATLMRHTTIPLADEFALRAIHVLDVAKPETLKQFFGFTDKEIIVLLRSLHAKQWIEYSGTGVTLSPQGKALFANTIEGEPTIVETYPYERSLGFEKLSFGPLPIASAAPPPRAIPRIDGSRDKAEDSKSHVRRGFRRFFRDIVSEKEERGFRTLDIYSVNDTLPRKAFRYIANIPVVADAAGITTAALVEQVVPYADFGQRHELIAGVAGPVERLQPVGEDQTAIKFLSYVSPLIRDFLDTKRPWLGTPGGEFKDGIHGLTTDDEAGIVGSLAITRNQEIFTEVTGIDPDTVRSAGSVVWLRPSVPWWGRSEDFLGLISLMKTVYGNGMTYLCTSDATLDLRDMKSMWGTRKRGTDSIASSGFDTGLVFPDGSLPFLFELAISQHEWCLCLAYTLRPGSQFPIPVGIISRRPETIQRAMRVLDRLLVPVLVNAAVQWDIHGRTRKDLLADLAGAVQEKGN